MKFLKAIGIGLVIFVTGQVLASALFFVEILSGLFGFSGAGQLSLALAGVSYYLAVGVTGFLLGRPDPGRAAVVALVLLVPAMVVPTLILDGLRLREVSTMTEALSPNEPALPHLPTVALVNRRKFVAPSEILACDWQCRELLVSGAAPTVVVAVGSFKTGFERAEQQAAWRFEASPQCRKAAQEARVLRRFEDRPAIPPPVETVSAQPAAVRDPLDRCFVPAQAAVADAQVALVNTIGPGPAPNFRDRPAVEQLREVLVRSAAGWRAVGRAGSVTFALEGFPFWPTPTSPLQVRPLGDRLQTRHFGSATVIPDYADRLIRAALESSRS